MSENKLFYYRGFPLIRSENLLYYGCCGDGIATRLTIKDYKTVGEKQVPNKIMVQLLGKNNSNSANKERKGEFTGFYQALDAAHIWLMEAIFGTT